MAFKATPLLRLLEIFTLTMGWLTGSCRWLLLFNREFYRARSNSRFSAFHFIFVGRFLGIPPHPLFDGEYYKRSNPDVTDAGWEPFAHFFRTGLHENRSPHPLFDGQHYLAGFSEQNRPAQALLHYLESAADQRVSPHPLYDADWVKLQTGRHVPIEEYLACARLHTLNPHPLFDVRYYGAVSTNEAPLLDYISHRENFRRSPHILFDAAFYLAFNPDVAGTGIAPLLHYVRNGRRELRNPHPLFDTAFYLNSSTDIPPSASDPLTDYLLRGGAAGRSPHPVFQSDYYLKSNPTVAVAGINPLVHFLSSGAAERRNPNPGFDIAFYANTYSADIGAMNPLVHYVLAGEAEARSTLPGVVRYLPVRRTTTPVDVIVPIRGNPETIACVESLLEYRGSNVPYEIVVVDDLSLEVGLRGKLIRHAEAGNILLLNNTAEPGFVAALNLALQLHSGRDAVIVNSDTLVANDWLTRLQAAVYSGDRTGTATPFTNSGTICGYPQPLLERYFPRGEFAAMDLLFREANAGRTQDIPTAVAFCMYIRRDCLNESGYFDAETFAGGYGAENDFCRRAAGRGWRHILAADVFVYNGGELSFSTTDKERNQRAFELVCRRHPGYASLVSDHLRRNPAAPHRAAVATLSLRRTPGTKVAVIACGDNAELNETPEGALLIWVKPLSAGAVHVESADAAYPVSAVLPANRISDISLLLRECGVSAAEVLDTGFGWPAYVQPLLQELNVPFDVTLAGSYPYIARKRAWQPLRVAALLSHDSSGRFDACAYVRALLPFGHEAVADLVQLTPIRTADLLTNDFDAVLVQRTAVAEEHSVSRILDWASSAGKTLIYETDDDLQAIAETHPDWDLYQDKKGPVLRLIEHADLVVVSTDELRSALSGQNRTIMTLPNALHEQLWLPEYEDLQRIAPSDTIRAVYMGSMTHDEDLELIREAVERLSREMDFRLEVVGVTAEPPERWYDRLPVASDTAPFYPKFVHWLKEQRRWHFGVAPLARNRLNDAKSYLKYLDYAALGLPGIFSASHAYSPVIKHGVSGLLVENSTDAWYEALSIMARDARERARLSAEALRDVKAKHTLAAQSGMRRSVCQQIFAGAAATQVTRR